MFHVKHFQYLNSMGFSNACQHGKFYSHLDHANFKTPLSNSSTNNYMD
jgi:hypothetical protein